MFPLKIRDHHGLKGGENEKRNDNFRDMYNSDSVCCELLVCGFRPKKIREFLS